jgi:hypothetical protein
MLYQEKSGNPDVWLEIVPCLGFVLRTKGVEGKTETSFCCRFQSKPKEWQRLLHHSVSFFEALKKVLNRIIIRSHVIKLSEKNVPEIFSCVCYTDQG